MLFTTQEDALPRRSCHADHVEDGSRPVVGLVGHAGSGKTTLSGAVQAALAGTAVVSFGDVMRARARTLGLDSADRDTLLDLGQRWVSADALALCRAVLSQVQPGGSLLVIDGIRHARVATELRDLLAPRRLMLVYLAVREDVLLKRLSEAGMSTEHAKALLRDPTEIEVDEALRADADLEVDGTVSPAENVARLLRTLIDPLGA